MISFNLEDKGRISKQQCLNLSLSDILKDNRHFQIYVDKKLFFDDEFFPIYEFVMALLNWDWESSHDFSYNTLDDYQNPLLSFTLIGDGWRLYSVWQEFQCKHSFTDQEIDSFVHDIISAVIE